MGELTPFEIRYKETDVYVVPKRVGRELVYILHFPYRRPPAMLSMTACGTWTFIPEETDSMWREASLRDAQVLGELVMGKIGQVR